MKPFRLALAATILLAGVSTSAFANRAERLMKMSEAEIQEKTMVVNQPWDPAIMIGQNRLPPKGSVDEARAWLDAAILTKPSPLGKSGDALFYVGAGAWGKKAYTGSEFRDYAHMKYMDSPGPAFINVNQTNKNGECSETIMPHGGIVDGFLPRETIEMDCAHSVELLSPILRSTVEYIASLDHPWEFQFVATDGTAFTDIITPNEAKALLDRVDEEKAQMAK